MDDIWRNCAIPHIFRSSGEEAIGSWEQRHWMRWKDEMEEMWQRVKKQQS
ncbi:hypothetical protein [Xenorhabdus koppenhoeferi]|nr:hypothetical protein [Xenorhabdus koppenhoeferi]